MGVNKVIYYGEVLVDMSQVTVMPETLGKGVTALDAKGDLITGTMEAGEDVTSETNAYTTKLATLDAAITALETELEGKAAGGGGGSSGAETCTVTINQVWRGHNDPELLKAFVLYYNAATAELLSTVLTSVEDNEPQHSITFTVLKNSIVTIMAGGFSATVVYSAIVSGGIMKEYNYASKEGNFLYPLNSSGTLYQFIPTEDTAVFTITSP